MIIMEQSGWEFMVTGVTKDQLQWFKNWLDDSIYSGVVSVSEYLVPKESGRVLVITIHCDTRGSHQEVLEWWSKGEIIYDPAPYWKSAFSQ